MQNRMEAGVVLVQGCSGGYDRVVCNLYGMKEYKIK